MIPKRVTLENFLSFGPKTEIAFADDEPLWVVGGPNGVGKSAVFDAITFCLFGDHRGGSKEIEPLVRYGASGFSVCVEFEFNGADYRVIRGRVKRPVQSVHKKVGDNWQAEPDIAKPQDVTAWAERTLGLDDKAFAASVLLRQGQADRIISAKPTERLAILKAIIGLERFEELGGTVKDASRKAATRRDELTRRRELLPAVGEEQVQAAAAAREAADARRTAADQAVVAAAERVQQAKRHQAITAERQEYAAKLAAADARAADAVAIRRDHARAEELGAVLPTLAKLVPLRDGLPAAERERDAASATLATQTAEREVTYTQLEAQRLAAAGHRQRATDLAAAVQQTRAEADVLKKELANAEQLARLDADLSAFEPDLDAQHAAAEGEVERATTSERAAATGQTEARTLLNLRQRDRDAFSGVEAGVCSRCGQTVGPEHVERERARLDALIHELADKAAVADQVALRSSAAVRTATDLRKQLAARIKQRDTLATQRQAYAALGASADVSGLRGTIQARLDTAAARETEQATERAKQVSAEAEVRRLDAAHTRLKTEVERLALRATESDHVLATSRTRADTLAGSLPGGWASATTVALETWLAEQGRLAAAGVAERFAALQRDIAERDVWTTRLTELAAESDQLPSAARVPVGEAERGHAAAVADRGRADADFLSARDAHADLARQAGELAQVVAALATAEQSARVHAKLDGLLGNAGLQRELVRRAETAIVGYANETAGKLSDGEMSVELAGAADGDKALDLLVRVGDAPRPTPVAYLSGSQKFRVAVAVALSIGRFATRGARPLECVIIDEGFGSLDRDGLRAAADELTRLRGCLKRIVLVSHQEEFAERFPAVIRLERGEAGTTAMAVRR